MIAQVGLLILMLSAPVQGVEVDQSYAEALVVLTPIEEEFEVAKKEHRQRLNELRESDEYKAAMAEEDYDKLLALSKAVVDPHEERWRNRFTEASQPFDGTEGSLAFAQVMLENRLTASPGEEVPDLIRKFASSAHLRGLLGAFSPYLRRMGEEEATEMMQLVLTKNESVEVQAEAHFALGSFYARQRNPSEEQLEKGLRHFDRVVELLPADSMLSIRARGPRFEKERLQVGMEAPDIVGVDLFGENFKLSDYRGKVVLLDFWGDW